MKKMFVQAYLKSNVGDDLFLNELFSRYKDTHFYLRASNNYEKTFKEFKNVTIIKNPFFNKIFNFTLSLLGRIFRLKNVKKHYKDIKINSNDYDGLVKIGGSIFIDNTGEHFKVNTTMYNNFLEKQKPVFILSCNFEKDYAPSLLSDYQKYFSNVSKQKFDICFRDSYSYNLFKDIPAVRCAPDIIFGLNSKNNKQQGRMGISIIDLENRDIKAGNKEKYYKSIANVIKEHLSDLQNEVVLFSFCKDEGDLKSIDEIFKYIEKEYLGNIKVVDYRYDLKLFLNEFSACEKIVATRFHAMILGWVFNQKVIPIIYSEKMRNVIEDLNYKGIAYDMNSISSFRLTDFINTINLDIKNLAPESKKQFLKLDSFLKNYETGKE